MRAIRGNWPRQAGRARLSDGSAFTGCAVALALVFALALSLVMTMWSPIAGAGARHRSAARPGRYGGAGASPGPGSQYDCTFNLVTDAFTGADGSASAIGWAGNHQGVVTCLGGTFLVQDGLVRDYGFGLYRGGRTTWGAADGYLPAQITSFRHRGALVTITEFADRVVLGGDAYVAVYARVAVANSTGHQVPADPEASPGLLPIASGPDLVAPNSESVHDYVVAVGPLRRRLPVACGSGVGGCRGLRSALQPHEVLLERPAGSDRRDRCSRCDPRRRLPEWIHLYPDRPERRGPEHRRQRLRE